MKVENCFNKKTGDVISIDAVKNTINLENIDEEFAKRNKVEKTRIAIKQGCCHNIFVRSKRASEGCVTDK
jgi:dihydroxy-acid dehydratase